MTKTKKEIKKIKKRDLKFIISAVTDELSNNIKYYQKTLDNNGGFQWFYDECVEIAELTSLGWGNPGMVLSRNKLLVGLGNHRLYFASRQVS